MANIIDVDDRPLGKLTKQQLFAYAAENPEDVAQMSFCRELLHRRAIEVQILEATDKIQERGIAARRSLARAGGTDSEARYQRLVADLEKDLARARAEVVNLPNNDYVVTHAEICAYFRARHWPEYEPMLKQYQEGTLFTAQRNGFAAFLGADPKDRLQDLKVWEKMSAWAGLCNDESGLTFLDAKALYAMRIIPSMSERQRFTTDDGMVANVHAFSEELQKDFYRWQNRYNAATLTHQWIDDSGVAYDTRQFTPDQV